MGQELHGSSVTVLREQRMPPPWDDAECAGVPLAASGDSSDEQGFAALVAQIDNDVKAGRELSANRKALQRAMAISAEVADGKLLSSEDMSALQCAFCDSLRYPAPSTAPPFSRATASRPFFSFE